MILYEDWRDLLRIFLCAKGEGIHIPLNEWSERIGLLRKGGNQRCEYGKPARSDRNRGEGAVYKFQCRGLICSLSAYRVEFAAGA